MYTGYPRILGTICARRFCYDKSVPLNALYEGPFDTTICRTIAGPRGLLLLDPWQILSIGTGLVEEHCH